jgi:hypothetical protein
MARRGNKRVQRIAHPSQLDFRHVTLHQRAIGEREVAHALARLKHGIVRLGVGESAVAVRKVDRVLSGKEFQHAEGDLWRTRARKRGELANRDNKDQQKQTKESCARKDTCHGGKNYQSYNQEKPFVTHKDGRK